MLGRKRHILTDTLGLLLAVSVHPASVQDRDGAEALLREARRSFPFLERIIGDAGYQGRKMETAVARTGTGDYRSFAAATGTASLCSRNGGLWSGHWHGSAVVAAWLGTTSVTPAKPPRSSASPWSASCCAASWQATDHEPKLPGTALRGAGKALRFSETLRATARPSSVTRVR